MLWLCCRSPLLLHPALPGFPLPRQSYCICICHIFFCSYNLQLFLLPIFRPRFFFCISIFDGATILLFLLVMSSMLAPGHRSRRPWWVQYTERAIQLINIDIVTINLLCCRDAVAFLVSWCILLLDLVGGGIVSSSRGRRRRR